MELTDLTTVLHEGNYSCVICNRGIVRTFSQRGVADLYDLLEHEPSFLQGACMADKVVGKAAASLMALGGVRQLYADIISRPALEILQAAHTGVECGKIVPHIINRTGTGWCPLESASRDLHTPQEILPVIRDFLSRIRANA